MAKSPTETKLRRPPVKRQMVVDHLRQAIYDGKYRPGERLPTRLELCGKFNTCEPTLQAAMSELVEEGFIETKGSLGTFVAEQPPHLYRYGIAFMNGPGHAGWTRFYAMLAAAARDQGIATYFNTAPTIASGVGDRGQMLTELENHQLAGLIFTTNPSQILPHILVEKINAAHVSFTYRGSLPPGWPTVDVDTHGFVDLALDHLAGQGCKRIAVLHFPQGMHPAAAQHLDPAMQARGMTSRSHWRLGIPAEPGETIRHMIHLLFEPGRSDRPDGLLVMDDNLLEAASLGLVDAGVKVGEEVFVAAHANFPQPTLCHVPAARFGFDVNRVLEGCLNFLAAQRDGRHYVDSLLIPAQPE